MHDDHDHHHHHDHDAADHEAWRPGPGHNRAKRTLQWQVPHRAEGGLPEPAPPAERDLDLVEASFVEGFSRCADPTSFLRLARIAFVGVDGAGRRLHLLRVETAGFADVGSISPLIGGDAVRYDPLPAQLVSRRQQLVFVYHDGTRVERLNFAGARGLTDESEASSFAVAARN